MRNLCKLVCLVLNIILLGFSICLITQCNRLKALTTKVDFLESPVKNAAEHIIAHRGASGEEKEHTFEAYDLAIEYGAIYIEQDLVFSKEGSLFVYHDTKIKNKGCEDISIAECTDSALDSMGVLSLKSVFDRYKSMNVFFVIEVRPLAGDNYNGKMQVEALIELIQEYRLSERIIVQAWEEESLMLIKNYDNTIKTMFLCSDIGGIESAIESNYVDIVSTSADLMIQEHIQSVHNAGKLYCAFTLNSTEDIEKAIQNDVDLYFTNYVAKAILLEREYRS